MILEIKTNDGKKCVIGGNFIFSVDGNRRLSVSFGGGEIIKNTPVKDYPTYSVGANIVFCEEAEG